MHITGVSPNHIVATVKQMGRVLEEAGLLHQPCIMIIGTDCYRPLCQESVNVFWVADPFQLNCWSQGELVWEDIGL